MDDELSKRGIERAIRKGQLLGGPLLDVDLRVSGPCSRNEWLGRIDGRHRRGAHPRGQLRRQRTRAATDIEHRLTHGYPGEVGELR